MSPLGTEEKRYYMGASIRYTIKRIDGDYAVLAAADGTENRLARALLPENADEGDFVVWENYEYLLEKN